MKFTNSSEPVTVCIESQLINLNIRRKEKKLQKPVNWNAV